MLSFRARASWLRPARPSEGPGYRSTRSIAPKTSVKAPKPVRSVSRLVHHLGRASPLLGRQSSRSYHSTQQVRSDSFMSAVETQYTAMTYFTLGSFFLVSKHALLLSNHYLTVLI